MTTRINELRVVAMLLAAGSSASMASSPERLPPSQVHRSETTSVDVDVAEPDIPTATAVVVRSWSECDSNDVDWQTLNENWRQFGSVRVRIAYHDHALCGDRPITYEALEASGAQTVILSDSAGGGHGFGLDSIQAIQRYVQEGHNLLGTGLLLNFYQTDNRALAPLFGLDASRKYGLAGAVGTVFTLRRNAPLFQGLGGAYTTGGYLDSQVPGGRRWTQERLGQARLLAHDAKRQAAILEFCGPGYRANLFTYMLEYGGNAQDQQVLYNALVMGRKPGCHAGESAD